VLVPPSTGSARGPVEVALLCPAPCSPPSWGFGHLPPVPLLSAGLTTSPVVSVRHLGGAPLRQPRGIAWRHSRYRSSPSGARSRAVARSTPPPPA
jgi:hypothetical protein